MTLSGSLRPEERQGLMSTVTNDIVQKLWNLCNVLKDDGVTYHQYVTELTYMLFLKMAEETGTEIGSSTTRSLSSTSVVTARRWFGKFLRTPVPSSRSRRRYRRLSQRSTNSTGTAHVRKGSAICTRASSRRMLTRRSPAPVSTSLLER
jgi:hypothetical protein